MKISLCILGILNRFGPQHGYQIKKIIAEHLADFAQIKLPVIYYHLDKMKQNGWLSTDVEKNAKRPEKTIYSLTPKGKTAYRKNLNDLLQFNYRPEFMADVLFYFSDSLEPSAIKASLKHHMETLQTSLREISRHKAEVLPSLPKAGRKMALIIFSHHEHHYQAELDWAKAAYDQLKPTIKA